MRRETRRRLAWCIIACCLTLLLACHILRCTSRPVYVHTPDLASLPGVRKMDPNSGLFEIIRREPNRVDVQWLKTELHVPAVCRVPRLGDGNVQVTGWVNDAREYPVVIDTGYDGHLLVTDTVVQESQLEIWPVADMGAPMGGFCRVDQFTVGQVAIVRPPSVFLLGHYEGRFLGKPTWIEKKIMLGLRVLSLFGHIVVDNLQDEVLFVMDEPFVPQDPSLWWHYPMSIQEEPSIRHKLLWIEIPLAGEVRHVAFDTGADITLTVSQANWQKLTQKLRPLRQRRARVRRPYGYDECTVVTVQGLDIAGMSVPGAEVYVNDSYAGGWCVGMQPFRETVLVLDFQAGRLWIRDIDAEPASVARPPE
jgi:hypothetical protein